jgi:NAD-dependent SIR2 family protein deacetylase
MEKQLNRRYIVESKIIQALDSISGKIENEHPQWALSLDKIADSIEAQSSTCNLMMVDLDVQKIEKALKNIETWISDMPHEAADKVRSNLLTANKSIEKIKEQLKRTTVRCSNCKESFYWADLPENAMGSVRCPQCGMNTDQEGNAHAS